MFIVIIIGVVKINFSLSIYWHTVHACIQCIPQHSTLFISVNYNKPKGQIKKVIFQTQVTLASCITRRSKITDFFFRPFLIFEQIFALILGCISE